MTLVNNIDSEIHKLLDYPVWVKTTDKGLKFGYIDETYTDLVPSYSTDLNLAWDVVRRMGYLQFTAGAEDCCGVRFDVSMYRELDMSDIRSMRFESLSLAHSICTAILTFEGVL